MTKSHHQAIVNRAHELEKGRDPDYRPVDIHYLASLDLGSVGKALHKLRELETTAWAKAEYCLVRDLGRLLNADVDFIAQWSTLPISKDPADLQSKAQALTFLAKIVRGSFDLGTAQPELSVASQQN